MTMNPNPPDPNLPPDRRRNDLAADRTSGAWGWWILVAIIVIGFIWWIGWGLSGGWGRNNNGVNAPVASPAPTAPPATSPTANSSATQPNTTQPQANNK